MYIERFDYLVTLFCFVFFSKLLYAWLYVQGLWMEFRWCFTIKICVDSSISYKNYIYNISIYYLNLWSRMCITVVFIYVCVYDIKYYEYVRTVVYIIMWNIVRMFRLPLPSRPETFKLVLDRNRKRRFLALGCNTIWLFDLERAYYSFMNVRMI